MIFDKILNCSQLAFLSDNFKVAFKWISEVDANAIEVGKHQIIEGQVFAIVAEDFPREINPVLECHREFADIQLALQGEFDVGIRTISAGEVQGRGYDSERDLEFLDGEPNNYLTLRPGDLLVLFPTDLHAPMPPKFGTLKKIIIKVRL